MAIGNRIARELRLLRADFQQLVSTVHDAEEAQSQKQNRQQYPPVLHAELNIPKAVQGDKGRRDDRQYRLQKWLTIGTWLAFVAASVYAGVAIFQWREMIAATGAAQQAVEEARRNRGQAEKSLNATIEQFHLEQRAWVSIKSVMVTKPFSKTESAEMTVNFTNTGKTPALNCGVTKKAVSFSADKLQFMPVPKPFKSVVAPGSEDATFLNVPPVPEIADAIAQHSVTVYLGIVIEYDDIFGKHHSTKFCGFYPTMRPPFFFNCEHGGSDMN